MKENTFRLNRVAKPGPSVGRIVSLVAVTLLMVIAGFFVYRTWLAPQPGPAPVERVRVSSAELEERYGLRLRLLAVTADGGLVDFRLKIVDAAKASQLLENPARAPSLIVEGSDTTLPLPRPIEVNEGSRLKDENVYIALIPNSGSAVRPGTPIVVTFGDVELEPVVAQ